MRAAALRPSRSLLAVAPLCALSAACAPKDRATLRAPLLWEPPDTAGVISAPDGEVEVELRAGSVTFADLRLHAPAATAARWRPADLLVGRARAHPGHDPAGDVQLEALGVWTVDLTAPEATLATLSGWEGEVGSASLRLAPAAPQALEGTLVSGATTLPFRLQLTEDDPIAGLAVEATLDAAAPLSAVRLQLDPIVALRPLVESAPLSALDTDGDGLLTEADTGAENSARFGLLSALSWTLTVDTHNQPDTQ